MATPGFNDVQRADLAKIWLSHCVDQLNDTVALDDICSRFVAKLTEYFLHVLTNSVPQEANDKPSILLDTFRSFFCPEVDDSAYPLNPILTSGRSTINLDHATFLSELEAHDQRKNIASQQSSSFGAFLYHKPSHGMCVTNSAVAMTMITLYRRSRANTHSSGSFMRSNDFGIQPESIIINTRFYNVYPTIKMQDVKTSNAYKFVTISGRIIKVHTKRLRLVKADVLCTRCGEQFGHRFHDGRYELPKRCGLLTNNGKKCPGQKFDLLRRTAQYIDCQRLKLQEEDNTTSTAGRTPRQIDLEVTHELVDCCHAGDCVHVAGVINAINSAMVSGRAGRLETSTYQLYMVANSITNTTADLHVQEKKNSLRNGESDESNRGALTFTDEQLANITKVAHAGKWFGCIPSIFL